MKTKLHALAGIIAFFTILSFWGSTLFSEIFVSHETIAMVKGYILKGMFILIPAMIIVGASGMSLGSQRQDALALSKKKRMPIIALTGILILLPAAFFLEARATNGTFDLWFYIVQGIELIAGASNLRLMGMNIRDGLKMTGRIGTPQQVAMSAATLPTIKAHENGPLLLSGEVNITDQDGQNIEGKALCRCGASKNKPFCDGSHNEIGFNDAISPKRTSDKIRVYKGKEIDVHYNRLACSHAGECVKRLGSVFNPDLKQWIKPDNGQVEEIKAVVKHCPSGALSYSQNKQSAQHINAKKSGIRIEQHGPYHINGIALLDTDKLKGACADKYVLCRCGASKNKPYCDGSHKDIAWKDA